MITLTPGGFLKALVDDTSPQLGGDLDGQSLYDINNMVHGNFDGEVRAANLTSIGDMISGTLVAAPYISGFTQGTFGALVADSPTLVVDAVNHRVGIGTVTPLALLHVGDGIDPSATASPTFYVTRNGQTDFAVRDSFNDVEGRMTVSKTGVTYGSMTNDPVFIRTNNVNRLKFGNVHPFTIETYGLMLDIQSLNHFTQFYETDGTVNKRRYRFTGVTDRLRLAAHNDAGALVRELISFDHDGKVGINVADPHSQLEVAGAISSATVVITASSDDLDVSGVNTVFVNNTVDIVLGGLVGGVDGQVVNFALAGNFINHCRFEHAEGIGGSTQDFINHTAADEDIDHGGCVYVCNGTKWYDISHARHV